MNESPFLRPVPDPLEGGPDGSPVDELEAPDFGSIVERAYLITVGLASLAAVAVVEAIVASMDPTTPRRANDAASTGLPVAAGAAMGMAAEAGAFMIRTGLQVVRTASGMASGLMDAFMGVDRSGWWIERVEAADQRGREERDRAQAAAEAFTAALIPPIADAVVDRLDLTTMVSDNVDLDAVVASVDLNRAVEGVDLTRVVDRIDLDAVAARLDVQAVIDRVDLVGIAEGLIAELDLPEIIRESSGAMATETVDGIRIAGMDADRLLTRIVDRILSRARGEAAPSPGSPDEDGGGS